MAEHERCVQDMISHVVHDACIEDETVEGKVGRLELGHEGPHRLQRGQIQLHESQLMKACAHQTMEGEKQQEGKQNAMHDRCVCNAVKAT